MASRPQHAYSPAVGLADVGDPYRDRAARVDDIELSLGNAAQVNHVGSQEQDLQTKVSDPLLCSFQLPF